MKFALEHRHWTEKDWSMIMFTDECNVELGKDSRVLRVWRRPGEAYMLQHLRPTFKSGRMSIGIWSYVMGGEIGPIVMLNGYMNGPKYVDMILKDVVWKRIRHIPQSNKRFHFMHDGAPCHRSKLATAFFEERQIRTLRWPPHSPDLNLIENLWYHLKRLINSRRHIPANATELRGVIEEEWARLWELEWKKVISSMPARMATVI